jgi:DNA-binding NarL/FixJ family response regulator
MLQPPPATGGIMDPICVAVHAPDPLTYTGLVATLRTNPQLRVVPPRHSTEAHVVVAALHHVTGPDIAWIRSIGRSTRAGVILIAEHLSETHLLTAIECGVVAMLPRVEATSEQLTATVMNARAGRAHLPEDLLGTLLTQIRALQRDVLTPNGLNHGGLKPREIDLLRMLAEGHNTDDIAAKLNCSDRTIKNYLHEIMTRLNLRNRSHAVAYAYSKGLI